MSSPPGPGGPSASGGPVLWIATVYIRPVRVWGSVSALLRRAGRIRIRLVARLVMLHVTVPVVGSQPVWAERAGKLPGKVRVTGGVLARNARHCGLVIPVVVPRLAVRGGRWVGPVLRHLVLSGGVLRRLVPAVAGDNGLAVRRHIAAVRVPCRPGGGRTGRGLGIGVMERRAGRVGVRAGQLRTSARAGELRCRGTITRGLLRWVGIRRRDRHAGAAGGRVGPPVAVGPAIRSGNPREGRACQRVIVRDGAVRDRARRARRDAASQDRKVGRAGMRLPELEQAFDRAGPADRNRRRGEIAQAGGRRGQLGVGRLRAAPHGEAGGGVPARSPARCRAPACRYISLPVRPGPFWLPLRRRLRRGQWLLRGQFRPVVHIGELVPLAAIPLRAVLGTFTASRARAGRRMALIGSLRPAVAAAALIRAGRRPPAVTGAAAVVRGGRHDRHAVVAATALAGRHLRHSVVTAPLARPGRHLRPAVVAAAALVRAGWKAILTAAATARTGGHDRHAVAVEALCLARAEITICASSAAILNSLIGTPSGRPYGTAAATWTTAWTTLRAGITLVTPTLATAVPGFGGGLIKLVRVLCSHVPRRHNDDDEDNHDNNSEDDHELSHRTIQRGMASWCGAGEARVAIDAGLSRLREHPGSIK